MEAYEKGVNALDEEFEQIASEIAGAWGVAPFFADLDLLPDEVMMGYGSHPIGALLRRAQAKGLTLVPVTGLRRPQVYQAAIARAIVHVPRACLRLHLPDLEDHSLQARVDRLLTSLSIAPAEVDLLVDFKLIDDTSPRFSSVAEVLPYLDEWKTVTFGGGSFPKDLTDFTVGDHNHPRTEWLLWRELVRSNKLASRLPGFCDYTTQHPYYEEPPFPPNFSASIRYAFEDYTVVMRGEWVGKEGSAGYQQWPANASELTQRQEFMGSNFSFGDFYIAKMAARMGHSDNPGNATTWLIAGVNHHITLVCRQFARAIGATSVRIPRNEAELYGQVPRPIQKMMRRLCRPPHPRPRASSGESIAVRAIRG
jgi:hypothetical protein